MSLPLPVVRLRTAMRLSVPQHSIDQYLLRTKARPKPAGHAVADLIAAEFIMGDHRPILDEGFPRVCVLWRSEPLVTLVKPVSAEDRPVVLTVLNFEMYQASIASQRFKPLEDVSVAEDAKSANDFRSQLGTLRSRLKEIRETLRVERDSDALRIIRQLAATRPG